MTRLETIIAERTERRRKLAEGAAARALGGLRAKGIDIRVFGSLARGDFRVHSDVDFLVYGPIDADVRVTVECGVAAAMRESGLPYDVIYLDDLTPAQAVAFQNE